MDILSLSSQICLKLNGKCYKCSFHEIQRWELYHLYSTLFQTEGMNSKPSEGNLYLFPSYISNLLRAVSTFSISCHKKTIKTLLRSEDDELQEREGPDWDVGDAAAGQHPLQRVRPGGLRVPESPGHHEEVISNYN